MLAMRKAFRALTGAGAMSLPALVPLLLVGLGSPQGPSPLQGLAPLPAIANASSWASADSPAVAERRRHFTTPTPPGEPRNGLAAIAAASARNGAPPPADQQIVVAYAPSADGAAVHNPVLAPVLPIDIDLAGVRAAIAAYHAGHAGNLAQGDDAAREAKDPLARTTLEWVALRLEPRLPFERIAAFLADHPSWPAADSLRRHAEVALYTDRRAPALISAYFADRPPETIFGKLALARAKLVADQNAAAALVREVWLSGDIGTPLEAAILREFGDLLSKDDHKARADRLFYKGFAAAARRAALLAGPDIEALAKARDTPLDATLVAALPAGLRGDPGLLIARVQKLRQQSKFAEAAKVMLTAPRDPADLVAPDEWWAERKLLARKLLDQSDARTAYRLCAESAPANGATNLESAFEAGWIALRFLHEPTAASLHFAAMAKIAATSASLASAAYWQGRAAEAAGATDTAAGFYRAAAEHATTYYGQLARAKRCGRCGARRGRARRRTARGPGRDRSCAAAGHRRRAQPR
jgi:soluble lytic murein transglycosylase